MSKVFNALSAYYDLIYENKNYAGEAAYIIDLIKTFRPGSNKILEFGSGTGKHAVLFCEHGFKVEGVEPSAEMLAVAEKLEHSLLTFQQASIDSYTSNQRFDVATALFHVVSYLSSNQELLSSFQNVHRHLKTDGLFIFDVWYSPAVLTQIPEKRVKVVENDSYKVIRHARPVNHWNKNIIDVVYDIEVLEKTTQQQERFSETHHMRHFSIPEIELLSMSSGFEVLCVEEFGTSKTAGPDTWGVNFVLKKK